MIDVLASVLILVTVAALVAHVGAERAYRWDRHVEDALRVVASRERHPSSRGARQ